MSTRAIARRYARALFELAQEGADLTADLETLARLSQLEEVEQLLTDPKLPPNVPAGVLKKAAGKLPKELGRLIDMLCARGKGCLLAEIFELFEGMQREAAAEVVAEVTTAVKLDAAAKDRLSESIARGLGKKVQLQVNEDAGIMGGVIIRVGDRQLDYSLRGRLEGLRRAVVA